MTNRRIAWIAAAFAVLVQAGFVVAFHGLITGCCGGLNQVPQPPPPPVHVFWFVHAAATPLNQLTDWMPAPFNGPFVVREWLSMLLYVALNAAFWFAGTFLLLKALVLACRLRAGPGVEGSRAGRRVHLVQPTLVRPRAMAFAVAILVSLAMISGVLWRRWWLAGASHALDSAITSVRTGRALPDDVKLEPARYSAPVDPESLAGPYRLVLDQRLVGTHPLDRFVPPYVGWEGELLFRTGSHIEFRVIRDDGRWRVVLYPLSRPRAVSAAREAQ